LTERIAFGLNGARVEVETDPMRRLADVLHHDLGLPGTKVGCTTGDCGACAVRVDERRVSACLVAVALVEGSEVVTVEGTGDREGS
jgi:aerobic-type carbon monoxide dehydrogenase small subunit (CoxS/CutS family)